MKIVPTLAGLILAGTFTATAHAGPSKGAIMTLCKSQVKDSIEDITRIRTAKFRDRASETKITFKVSTENADPQKVTCTYKDGIASLSNDKGNLAVVDKEVVVSGS